MKNKYAILKQIIDLLEDYEIENKNLDVLDFGYWIIKNLQEKPELNKSVYNKKRSADTPDTAFIFKNKFDDKARFLEATARIARYHEFYIRKFLKDMLINTRLEFLFLQYINLTGKTKKTDLINTFNLEYTTGMDTIKRLINNGLIDEIQDETDKRIKLLDLSPLGITVFEQSKKRIADESSIFFAAINDNKWKKVLPVLEEIDEFHNEIYRKHSNKTPAEISNLMDSLKHFK